MSAHMSVHTCLYTCPDTRLEACLHSCLHTCLHTSLYTCLHTCLYTPLRNHQHVHTLAYAHIIVYSAGGNNTLKNVGSALPMLALLCRAEAERPPTARGHPNVSRTHVYGYVSRHVSRHVALISISLNAAQIDGKCIVTTQHPVFFPRCFGLSVRYFAGQNRTRMRLRMWTGTAP